METNLRNIWKQTKETLGNKPQKSRLLRTFKKEVKIEKANKCHEAFLRVLLRIICDFLTTYQKYQTELNFLVNSIPKIEC